MRNFSKFLAAAVGLASVASLAFAMDQTIQGKTLLVKGGDPAKRKVTASAKEKGSPNTIVGDPTQNGSPGGAILTIFVNGATSSSGSFLLPQGLNGNKSYWTATNTGFKYKDPKGNQGPVKSVLMKRTPSGSFSIKAKLSGKNGIISVVPPGADTDNFGCVALKLGTGNAVLGDRYSIEFGTGSKFINNATPKFKATKPPGQGVCPVVTTSTTTSTTAPSTIGTTTTTSSTTTTTSPRRFTRVPPVAAIRSVVTSSKAVSARSRPARSS